jgi:hypothetical protein
MWMKMRIRTSKIHSSRLRNRKAINMNRMRRMLRTAAKEIIEIRTRRGIGRKG